METKSVLLQVRLTPAQRLRLANLANQDDITVSEWIRRAIKEGKLRDIFPFA